MASRSRLGPGLLLTGCAGFVDAVGFIELGGYFTSFMSGNTTQLGIALAGITPVQLVLPASLLLLFFLGSFCGAFLAMRATRRGGGLVLLLIIAAMLAAIGASGTGVAAELAMLPLAFAMGAQNALLSPSGTVRLGATFVTGTLFNAGQDLAGALLGKVPPLRWLQHLAVWLSLLVGGLAGALAFLALSSYALLVPLAVYLGFVIPFARASRRHA